MSIQPEGEDLRKAVKWISEQRQDDPDQQLPALVEAASRRYNLSPRDETFLSRFVREESDEAAV